MHGSGTVGVSSPHDTESSTLVFYKGCVAASRVENREKNPKVLFVTKNFFLPRVTIHGKNEARFDRFTCRT